MKNKNNNVSLFLIVLFTSLVITSAAQAREWTSSEGKMRLASDAGLCQIPGYNFPFHLVNDTFNNSCYVTAVPCQCHSTYNPRIRGNCSYEIWGPGHPGGGDYVVDSCPNVGEGGLKGLPACATLSCQ